MVIFGYTDTQPPSSELKLTFQDIYMSFCKFGDPSNKGTMTGAKFFKFCKDCKIADSKITRTDIDMLFAKIKVKGTRTITFSIFKSAIPQLAAKKYGPGSEEKLTDLIKKNGFSKSSGTKAKATRFHDDKSQYTGVYKNGGPSSVSGHKITLSKMMDRSKANVRGVNYRYDHNK
eukprot:jgi/Bigna1/133911/aug1.23_g8619